MSILDAALKMGRGIARTRMTETVTVGVYADATDAMGNATRSLVLGRYSGPVRVKDASMAVSDRDEPSQVVAEQEPALSIPTGSPALHKGDEVHVTASTADTLLVGRRYMIAGLPQSGQTTAHRYPLKEIT